MGFNNEGAAVIAERLRRLRASPSRPVVGVNIGKSRVVPSEHAVIDYVASTRCLAPHADYLVVNISSPNTPGLRDLQAVARLRPLLTAVREASDGAAGGHVPLLVKIAPDLADRDILAIADLALELNLDGLVATMSAGRQSVRGRRECRSCTEPGPLRRDSGSSGSSVPSGSEPVSP